MGTVLTSGSVRETPVRLQIVRTPETARVMEGGREEIVPTSDSDPTIPVHQQIARAAGTDPEMGIVPVQTALILVSAQVMDAPQQTDRTLEIVPAMVVPEAIVPVTDRGLTAPDLGTVPEMDDLQNGRSSEIARVTVRGTGIIGQEIVPGIVRGTVHPTGIVQTVPAGIREDGGGTGETDMPTTTTIIITSIRTTTGIAVAGRGMDAIRGIVLTSGER